MHFAICCNGVRSPLHMLVQNIHVDVRSGPEHVVRLMLSADSVQGAADEVGPLVRLRRGRSWASVVLSRTKRFKECPIVTGSKHMSSVLRKSPTDSCAKHRATLQTAVPRFRNRHAPCLLVIHHFNHRATPI